VLSRLSKYRLPADEPLIRQILENINFHLPVSEHPTKGHQSCSNQNPLAVEYQLFRTTKTQGRAGKLEICYGSVSYFQERRLRPPRGLGLRCNYSPPLWLTRMMMSISMTVCLFPYPSFRFNINYSNAVPWESDILTFAFSGNLEGLIALMRAGQCLATDRDCRGTTALHVRFFRLR
jgi:hypothetical protein